MAKEIHKRAIEPDETEYVMSNPKLVEQIEQGMKAFDENKFFPAPQEIVDEIDYTAISLYIK